MLIRLKFNSIMSNKKLVRYFTTKPPDPNPKSDF